jgi:hypothetical protein
MEKVHPDDIAFKVKTWLKNLQSEAPHDAVCRFRGADGQYRWFNVRGEALRASDGRVLRWYGVLIDIDDRTIAEEALRASEYKLQKIWSVHFMESGIRTMMGELAASLAHEAVSLAYRSIS